MSLLLEAIQIPSSPAKPRERGMNFCLDDGLSVDETRAIFETGAAFIDNIRVGRVTAAFLTDEWVRAKADICRKHAVDFETGGPLYEIAAMQGKVEDFLRRCLDLGFSSVEMSENVLEISSADLARDIGLARKIGLDVYFEYGRKYPDTQPFDVKSTVTAIKAALDAGSRKVVIERAEIDLVIENKAHVLSDIADQVGLEHLIFECGPRKVMYPELLIRLLGADVNLGNVVLSPCGALDGYMLLENARRGLDRSTGYEFLLKNAKLPFALDPTSAHGVGRAPRA